MTVEFKKNNNKIFVLPFDSVEKKDLFSDNFPNFNGKSRMSFFAYLIKNKIDITNSNMFQTRFVNKDFNNINFSQCDMSKSKFIKCQFKYCNFTETDFSHTTFINCTFYGCDWTNTDKTQTKFINDHNPIR